MAVLAFSIGTLVIVGWAVHSPVLISVLPGSVSMKANTAFGFVLASVALWLVADEHTRAAPQRAARACAALVALLGLSTLLQYATGLDFGIDNLVFVEAPGTTDTVIPGRMAPTTAGCFFTIGLALLLLRTQRMSNVASALAYLTLGVVGLPLVGYIFEARALRGIPHFTSMAFPTAIAFFGLAVGIIAARPAHGLISIVTGGGVSSLLARRLLVVAVVVPILVGWVRLQGQRVGLYDTETGLALMTTLQIALLFAFVWWTAAEGRRLEAERNLADERRRTAEQELRQLNGTLERKVEERTEEVREAISELEAFSYSISHDLRAPLRAMDGFSRRFEEEFGHLLPVEARRYLGVVKRKASFMGELVDDLLLVSRLGRQRLHYVDVQPADKIRAALARLDEEKAGWTGDVIVNQMPSCRGDSELLEHVYTSLLSNALKFSRGRSLETIECGALTDGGSPIYYVRDHGIGFDMRYVDTLFGVFHRLEPGNGIEGTGVGLAIVNRIVRRHGGRVWAESVPGEGSCFYFTLALEPDSDARASSDRSSLSN